MTCRSLERWKFSDRVGVSGISRVRFRVSLRVGILTVRAGVIVRDRVIGPVSK